MKKLVLFLGLIFVLMSFKEQIQNNDMRNGPGAYWADIEDCWNFGSDCYVDDEPLDEIIIVVKK